MRHERAFIDTYGMHHADSALARAAFDCIHNGLIYNMTWDSSDSVIPELKAHYQMDRKNRLYAIRAQNGDLSLFTSFLEAADD